ncbi:hypothetical protein GpartN1_g4939.t1 [Galdieria partita]|uniref:ERCC4 domain-containing protein n=1 Tax=Galdieria partita TaxID=83374 RepID=A0A9C7URP5_9RHOD|nr:hypothetical protein GpartN1_g4939.t1 [Galdieria partita]
MVLEYERLALREVEEQDGLCIVGRGLGVQRIVSKLVKNLCRQQKLILGLRFSKEWLRSLEQWFLVSQKIAPHCYPREIDASYSRTERQSVYHLQQGFLIVSSTILVHDLLLHVIPADKVSCVVVNEAEFLVDESRIECFIIRLLKEQNKNCSVKAFSERAEYFTRGFHLVEKAMRNLRVTKLYLWPRFRVEVDHCLQRSSGQLVELEVRQTPKMASLSKAILEAMGACLVELKRRNKSIDVSELDIESALFKSFDFVILKQLEPMWHNVSSHTKQLIRDLRTLRNILTFATKLNCVSFFNFLMAITQSEDTSKSNWLMSKTGEKIFTYAKSRIYQRKSKETTDLGRKEKRAKSASTSNIPLDMKVILEPSPKWSVLHSLLQEIRAKTDGAQWDEMLSIGYGCRVIIFVKDVSTMVELSEIVKNDKAPEEYLRKEFQKLLKSRDEAVARAKRLLAKEIADSENFDEIEAGLDDLQVTSTNEFTSYCSNEDTLGEQDLFHNLSLEIPDIEIVTVEGRIETWKALEILESLKPRFVIMYEPQNSLIRQLEVYQNEMNELPLEVFCLVYENSVEKDKFEKALQYEAHSFERLIREKENMVVYVEEEYSNTEKIEEDTTRFGIIEEGTSNRTSRKIRGRIYVDMREFRSKLPQLLYDNGVELIPVTLSIGDYVLSKSIFVERKSLSDLTSSLQSGRLFSQVQQLCRHCRFPCLLIEFPPGKSFLLSSFSELVKELNPISLLSRLVLLTIHFPTLRLIWCHTEYFCGSVFAALKSSEPIDELPDIDSLSQPETDSREYDNYSAVDLLLQLPGVHERNVQSILNRFNSIQELCNADEAELEKTLGSNHAKILYEFLHSTTPNLYEGQFK